MPTDHPILFTGEMVRAILEDRKTQTRRVVNMSGVDFRGAGGKNGSDWDDPSCWGFEDQHGDEWALAAGPSVDHVIASPYGQPGDLLYWANEPIEFIGINSLPGACRQVGTILSLFDGSQREVSIPDVDNLLNGRKVKRPVLGRWRGRRLPIEWVRDWRWPITDVRVQRVQEISEQDAKAEGVDYMPSAPAATTHRTSFGRLWDSINARRGYGWDVNPWVWPVTFKRRETDAD